MKAILIIGVFQAFFFALLILQKKTKSLHHYILASWLIYLGIFVGVYAIYSDELFTWFPYLVNFYISLLLLHGPFLYFYTTSLISGKEKVFNIRQLLHFIPILLFNIYLIIAFQIPRLANNIHLDHVHSITKLPFIYIVFLFVIVLSGPFYFIWTIRMLHRHGVNILNKYSYTEHINLSWLRNLVIVFGIIWTSLMFFAIVYHAMFMFTPDFCTNGLFLSLTGFILLVGYFGLKQSVIITADDKSVNKDTDKNKLRYAGSVLKKEAATAYLNKLEAYMHSEKPFMNGSLSLQELAENVNIPSHYLSQIINEHYHKNFFDYINHYRVEEAKSKINNPKYDNYTLLGIAFDSGFNSKTAFNRVFKKVTGITPGEYKKAIASTSPETE